MTFPSASAGKIAELEEEIQRLKRTLEDKTNELQRLICAPAEKETDLTTQDATLSRDEIMRYSRQMIVPAIGVSGQKKLKSGAVLIIGCGGLGCPAAQYLAGCGIGRLGLVDYDEVECSNLHRQLLHTESSIGTHKVDSLATALHRLNSKLVIDKYRLQLDSSNALDIAKKYDVIVDASDNMATRYLVNDACILAGRPLVSGSAVSFEAQLTVYNYQDGPCYRCLFSVPPPPETVSNCSDVGVVGPVPGAIGVLQALQAINIITGKGKVLSQRLLLFDGEEMTFKTVKIRGKSEKCAVCGTNPTITELIDYEQFCGSPANDKDLRLQKLDSAKRVTARQLKLATDNEDPLLIVDVRSEIEYEMCRLPGSVNIPLKRLQTETGQADLKDQWSALNSGGNAEKAAVYVVCRRGNDSQLGVQQIEEILPCPVYDVIGGLHAWSRDIDETFPPY